MSKLVIVIGKTNSGKDTVANHLCDKGLIYYHPLSFLKRQLEDHYEVPVGYMDTREGKAYRPPGANSTLQEIQVDTFHFWRKHDPEFTTRKLRKELPELLNKGDVVAISLRNIVEVASPKAVLDIVHDGCHDLLVLELIAPGRETPESSEYEYNEIRNILMDACDKYVAINNSPKVSLQELYSQVDKANAN